MNLRDRLANVPNFRKMDKHLWGDYFELLCLAEKELFLSDLLDIINPPEQEDIYGVSEENENVSRTEKLEKFELEYTDTFRHLELRQQVLEPAYPFVIKGTNIYLKQKLDNAQYAYIYLLVCSSLSKFADKQSVLTSDFEYICLKYLEDIMPVGSEIYVFGKNTINEQRYTGRIEEKLKRFAEDIKSYPKPNLSYSQYDTGDGGADIVGWFDPWKDQQASRVLILAQCKCSDQWYERLDAKQKLSQVVNFVNDVNNFYFIPFFYRNAEGSWHKGQHAHEKILVDRLRLMKLFPVEFFTQRESYTIIKQIITT